MVAGRLRVLHVISSLDPALGGPAVILPEMAGALARTGEVDVTIYTVSDELREPRREVLAGYELSSFPPVGHPALRRRAVSSSLARALWRDVQSFSLVHTHGIFTPAVVFANEVCRVRRIPFAARACGALDAWSLGQGSRAKRPFLRALTRPELRAAAFVHCTSSQEASDVRRVEPRARTEVLPHGIEQAPFARASPAAARARYGRYVLFLGRLHEKKRPDLLLDAFALLAPHDEGLQLVLAGPEEGMRERLVAMARGLGLAERVHMPGLVTGADKLELLRGAAAFALPSQQENFGIAILEACAAGCPPVVSDRVALAGEVARFAAGELVGLDAASLAAGLRRVLSNRESYTAGSRRLADAFSWEAAARRLVAAYRRAVEERRT